jgi:hypothetical protein
MRAVVGTCTTASCLLVAFTGPSYSAPKFAQYPASVYFGTVGRLDLSSPESFSYRTRLRPLAGTNQLRWPLSDSDVGTRYRLRDWRLNRRVHGPRNVPSFGFHRENGSGHGCGSGKSGGA